MTKSYQRNIIYPNPSGLYFGALHLWIIMFYWLQRLTVRCTFIVICRLLLQIPGCSALLLVHVVDCFQYQGIIFRNQVQRTIIFVAKSATYKPEVQRTGIYDQIAPLEYRLSQSIQIIFQYFAPDTIFPRHSSQQGKNGIIYFR